MYAIRSYYDYDFIRFENRGVSRSEQDCLLCEVHCEPFAAFLKRILGAVFDSVEVLRSVVAESRLGLFESPHGNAALLCFYSEDKAVEIVASVEADGRVRIRNNFV